VRQADTQDRSVWKVVGKQVTVDLGGTAPVRINCVRVSAMLGLVFDPKAQPRPADLTCNRFTAVRRFEIGTCNERFRTARIPGTISGRT
jgi:hypothetical protein